MESCVQRLQTSEEQISHNFHFQIVGCKVCDVYCFVLLHVVLIPQHICSCFSSSYVWLSSQVYNNLLRISDFPPSSSVLMNLFTLMEHKQLHLSCAISLVYSTSL